MTKQEAIENLRYLISEDCTDTQDDYIDEIEIAISAIEKQIPKKPKVYESWYGTTAMYCEKYYSCLDCDCELIFNEIYHDSFCPDCGQALDWSEIL